MAGRHAIFECCDSQLNSNLLRQRVCVAGELNCLAAQRWRGFKQLFRLVDPNEIRLDDFITHSRLKHGRSAGCTLGIFAAAPCGRLQ